MSPSPSWTCATRVSASPRTAAGNARRRKAARVTGALPTLLWSDAEIRPAGVDEVPQLTGLLAAHDLREHRFGLRAILVDIEFAGVLNRRGVVARFGGNHFFVGGGGLRPLVGLDIDACDPHPVTAFELLAAGGDRVEDLLPLGLVAAEIPGASDCDPFPAASTRKRRRCVEK